MSFALWVHKTIKTFHHFTRQIWTKPFYEYATVSTDDIHGFTIDCKHWLNTFCNPCLLLCEMSMCNLFRFLIEALKPLIRVFITIPNPMKDPVRCRVWFLAIGTKKFSFPLYKYSKKLSWLAKFFFFLKEFFLCCPSELVVRSPNFWKKLIFFCASYFCVQENGDNNSG